MISFQSLKLLAASSLLAISVSLPSHAGVHVNVNVGIGTPGYYGVLPIQGVTPSLWNANPIVAIGAALAGAPIYLIIIVVIGDGTARNTAHAASLYIL